MISVDKKGVELAGTMSEILSDLAGAMHEFRRMAENHFSKEAMDILLQKVVDMSGMNVEELKEENKRLKKFKNEMGLKK